MRPFAHPTRPVAVALLCIAMVGLTGCTDSTPTLLNPFGPTPAAPSSTAPPSASPTPSASAAIPIQDIGTRAVDAVGSGSVVSIAQEADATSWAVRVVAPNGSEQEVHIGIEGTVRSGPTTDPTDADAASRNRALVAATVLDVSKGAQLMAAAVPGGVVTKIELGVAGDRVVWQGDVVDRSLTRHEVRIDVVNGSVLQADMDGATPSPGS